MSLLSLTDCKEEILATAVEKRKQRKELEKDERERKFELEKKILDNELELARIKLGNDLKDWLPFWSQFQHIDKDEGPEDKFQYLIKATIVGSRAREVVESFPTNGANYSKTLESLKSRFGKDDLLVENLFFSEDFLKAWNRNNTSGAPTEAKERLNNLMPFLKTEVEGEERISLAMKGFGLRKDEDTKRRERN
ncbi:uncharacterized protein CDAR_1631 [Caerostris darwini]|uniref:Uncharacterized protein n=1 Tax=Caerostris darwini TaxID=1538125 RepID=A0AAV4R616_9ARAC|nr:uncharacterized protein CDAR_1631 [Caerostris darwini]